LLTRSPARQIVSEALEATRSRAAPRSDRGMRSKADVAGPACGGRAGERELFEREQRPTLASIVNQVAHDVMCSTRLGSRGGGARQAAGALQTPKKETRRFGGGLIEGPRAELVRRHLLSAAWVRRADEEHVEGPVVVGPGAATSQPLVENAQQLRLQIDDELDDLIEENRAPVPPNTKRRGTPRPVKAPSARGRRTAALESCGRHTSRSDERGRACAGAGCPRGSPRRRSPCPARLASSKIVASLPDAFAAGRHHLHALEWPTCGRSDSRSRSKPGPSRRDWRRGSAFEPRSHHLRRAQQQPCEPVFPGSRPSMGPQVPCHYRPAQSKCMPR